MKRTRPGEPKRLEAYRLRDQRVPVEEIAARLDVSAATVWRWIRIRSAGEPVAAKARRLLGELTSVVDALAVESRQSGYARSPRA